MPQAGKATFCEIGVRFLEIGVGFPEAGVRFQEIGVAKPGKVVFGGVIKVGSRSLCQYGFRQPWNK